MKLPVALQRYLGLVYANAAFLAALAWLAYPGHLGTRDLYFAAVLAAMIAAAQHFPLQVAEKTKVILDTAPIMAAVLLLSPPLAVTACGVGKGVGQAFGLRGPWFQKAFNTSTSILQAGSAVVLYSALRHGDLANDLDHLILPIGLAALSIYVTNMAIVEGVVSIQTRRRPFQRWWKMHGQELQHEGCLLLLGTLGALTAQIYPWMLAALFAPSAIIYRSLRDGMQLQRQTRATVENLADIVDMRDHYTFEHSRRVAEMSRSLALAMKLSADEAEDIYVAARVHDVGKIGIKGQILLKESALTDEEWQEMRTHPEVGAMLVGNLPEFRKGRELILSHHERFDGRGYPRALAGAAIPLGARIMTVADAFDAMTSHRSYRRAQPREYVIDQLCRGRGTQFDPAVVDVFIEMITVGKHAPEYWQAEAPHDHASSATLAVHSAGLPA